MEPVAPFNDDDDDSIHDIIDPNEFFAAAQDAAGDDDDAEDDEDEEEEHDDDDEDWPPETLDMQIEQYYHASLKPLIDRLNLTRERRLWIRQGLVSIVDGMYEVSDLEIPDDMMS